MSITSDLLRWHDPSARELPWRAEPTTPFGVLVSEIMAQQTQAERAAGAWTTFMAAFPTPAALAAAPTAQVLTLWKGLGYNRRGVNLQRAAAEIVAQHNGEVPTEIDGLVSLPGVGPYTARAVLAFAYGAATIPVDTNVSRILARLAEQPLNRRQAQERADALLQEDGTLNGGAAVAGALMDLGAGVCTAKKPRCAVCPLRERCRWRGADRPDPAASSAARPRAQGRFEGSRRQARGRLVDALRVGPLTIADAEAVVGEQAGPLLVALCRDGLAERRGADGTVFALPGWTGKA